MTPEQERVVFERLARLEDFARRVTGLLAATGKVLDMAPMVAQPVTMPSVLAGPGGTRVRRLYDFGEEPSEGAKHIDD